MKFLRIAAILTTVSLVLTGCSKSADEPKAGGGKASQSGKGTSAAPGAITIKHAFGETVINKKPERIAAVAWGNQEVPLALGVVPVGMQYVSWGSDTTGMLPWVADKVKELGGEPPKLFEETDSIPFDQIADTHPDVILAAYSGMSQDDYNKLRAIAPTVAYPDKPWGTSMEQMIEMNATAMGKEAEGKKLAADLKKQIQASVAKHAALKGKKVLFTAFGPQNSFNKLGFYRSSDPRAGFLYDSVGMGIPNVVAEESKKSGNDAWVEVSAEDPTVFDDIDMIVAYGMDSDEANQEWLGKLQKDPLLGKIKAIKQGKVAFLDNGAVGAVANPSPLSIPWGLDKYLDVVESAATS